MLPIKTEQQTATDAAMRARFGSPSQRANESTGIAADAATLTDGCAWEGATGGGPAVPELMPELFAVAGAKSQVAEQHIAGARSGVDALNEPAIPPDVGGVERRPSEEAASHALDRSVAGREAVTAQNAPQQR